MMRVAQSVWVVLGILVVLRALLVSTPAQAQPCFEHLLGSTQLPGGSSMTLVGTRAYVATLSNGMYIMDVSDPLAPAVLGAYSKTRSVRDISIVGETAYIADERMGLVILDVSDPAHPTRIGGVSNGFPNVVQRVAVQGSIACIIDVFDGLLIIDINNPAFPVILTQYYPDDFFFIPSDVAMVGTTAYVGCRLGGLFVLDISDPANPVLLNEPEEFDQYSDVVIEGDRLYAQRGSTLEIYDITEPQSPVLVGTYSAPESLGEISVANGVLTATEPYTTPTQIVVLDVSDPGAVSLIGQYHTRVNAGTGVVIGEQLAVLDGFDGLVVFDLNRQEPDRLVGDLDLPHRTPGLQIEGSLAYLAGYDKGLVIVDVSDSASPVTVGSVDTPGLAFDVAVEGGVACVAGYDLGLQVIDVSDPASPRMTISLDTPGTARRVAMSQGIVFVADDSAGLHILDVSDPYAPAFRATHPASSRTLGVFAQGTTAYVASHEAGLEILDVSDPSTPTVIGTFATQDDALRVKVVENIAYITESDGIVEFVDVQDPSSPVRLGGGQFTGLISDLAVNGNTLAILAGGLHFLDITAPEAPEVVAWIPLQEHTGVVIRGEIAYLSKYAGLSTYDLSPCDQPCLPDTNHDGMVTPADFTAWIAAFNAQASECDQNDDGLCTPADFAAWIANFNAGC